MPLIPRYEQRDIGSLELRAPKQNLRMPSRNFQQTDVLGGLLKEGAKLADTMFAVRQKKKQEADRAWVSEATAQLSDKFQIYEFGDEQNPGAYDQKGENTNGLLKRSKPVLQGYIDEIMQNAPSDQARTLFGEKANGLRVSTSRSLARHEQAETESWKNKAAEAELGAMEQDITRHWSDEPQEIEAKIAGLDDVYKHMAERQGKPVEEVKRESVSKVYEDVIKQNIAIGATDKAKDLLNRWTDKLDADTRIQITDVMRKKEIANKADDLSFNYYERLQAGQVSVRNARDEIRAIEDPDLRRATRRLFDSYARQHKQDAALWLSQHKVDIVDKIDAEQGNLVAQQRIVDELPEDTSHQRKVKATATIRLNRHKAAQGMRPMTDPEAYAEAELDIAKANITIPEQIDEKYTAEIEKADRDRLKRDLTVRQKVEKAKRVEAYTSAFGMEGGVNAPLSKAQKRDYGEFSMWADKVLKETNRGNDPNYIQELADTWVLGGERKSWYTSKINYGEDVTLGKAIREGTVSTWLPDMPSEDIVAGIKEKLDANPETKEVLSQKYGGNEELMIRAYHKKMLQLKIGKQR